MITTIIATIIALGVLVTVHEFGHYWVAKRCGVRILRFSVGFGRALYTWKDRTGTEFCVASIPLGGYVKMLDGREHQLTEEERKEAFDQKSVGQRFLIVAAGPGINFIFAAIVYALISMIGVETPVPVVGELPSTVVIKTRLPAEVVSFDGRPMESWEQISLAMVDVVGDSATVQIGLKPLNSSIVNQVALPVPKDLMADRSPLALYGVKPWSPPIEVVIARVLPDGAAQQAGLMPGDRILEVNRKPVANWPEFVAEVKGLYSVLTEFMVVRAGQQIMLSITPDRREGPDGPYGFIGIGPELKPLPPEFLRIVQEDPFTAFWVGIKRTTEMSWFILKSLGKIISGVISPKNLSGPITIAEVAGNTFTAGMIPYLTFVAFLSVSLGVFNLLPIPVLDGGHLVYFFIEAITGKPLSESFQVLGMKIGIMLLASLMLFATYNDILRQVEKML